VGILTTDDRPNGYPGSLDPRVPTVAERLGERGYATALLGKWHLSSDTNTPNETWPTRRGFDEFYGILGGAASYYDPPLYEGEQRIERGDDPDYYLTDDLSRRAVEFVDAAVAGGTPFFLYLAYTAPHWPLHAPEHRIAHYRERYRRGWDELRRRRADRLSEVALEHVVDLPHDPEVPPFAGAASLEWEAERMATYAAQVEAMDAGVGRLLDALDAHGVRDDTLVIFTSDNGASAEALPFSPSLTAHAGRTRDGREVRVGNEPAIRPGPDDGFASYGRSWAQLSNTPFRRYKRWVHEGGIAVPFLASWPHGGVTGGGVSAAPAHIVDVAPTIMTAVGGVAEGAGESLLELLRAPRTFDSEERTLCWEHMGNAAIRRGRWKLVRDADQPWELYDLAIDRRELHDVAGQHPTLVAELERAWHDWADANGVIPWSDVLADFRARGRALPG
jgi:arylsulfatase